MPEIPRPVLAVVAEELANFNTHTTLDNLFDEVGAPGEAFGNKIEKARQRLNQINAIQGKDPLSFLGPLLHELLESEGVNGSVSDNLKRARERITNVLGKNGLTYLAGGRIGGASGVATKSLQELLAEHDFAGVEAELRRCLDNVDADPPAALTSACAIIEAVCSHYIDEKKLTPPTKRTIKELWHVAQKDLGLEPGAQESDDLKRVFGGLASIVDGIGALRTHAGSAHGRADQFVVTPRHARLAIHAAQTLVHFLIETWQA